MLSFCIDTSAVKVTRLGSYDEPKIDRFNLKSDILFLNSNSRSPGPKLKQTNSLVA